MTWKTVGPCDAHLLELLEHAVVPGSAGDDGPFSRPGYSLAEASALMWGSGSTTVKNSNTDKSAILRVLQRNLRCGGDAERNGYIDRSAATIGSKLMVQRSSTKARAFIGMTFGSSPKFMRQISIFSLTISNYRKPSSELFSVMPRRNPHFAGHPALLHVYFGFSRIGTCSGPTNCSRLGRNPFSLLLARAS